MSKYISTHWGTYKVNQDKENNISLDYWEKDSYPTSFGLKQLQKTKCSFLEESFGFPIERIIN